ncbi:MAG: glycogen debranching protein GlgX [Acidobacteria bacterium]|nr:glycogen debranching protein GlgX [Acidobacteriota bacterium]
MRVWPGKPHPLGTAWDGLGVNVALFSEHATAVDLCLFDAPGDVREASRVRLLEHTDHVWHAYLPDVRPGQLYGFRVDGPYAPDAGHRFNSAKVVLDPYAKTLGRALRWHDSIFGYTPGHSGADLVRDDRDDAAYAPLAAVIDPAFTWGDDRRPQVPWHRTVIYELHVKGFTARHPGVPEPLRGKYLGLASDEAIQHLVDLGVTSVELMPVHQHASDRHLVERGLANYWGYNSLAYFVPDVRYATSTGRMAAVREFKIMVRALHAAGLEVILDVVYNHTAEGDERGPTLSLRGIDNASYYRLMPGHPRRYQDFTGCGNTLNMRHPRVLQLIMDSLRYWAVEMHVDGFRFDLASALARELFDVDKLGSFFDIIQQDPVLSQVKLIAEPWDLGEGGYQVGNFPAGWTEWNGRYRDAIRQFWRGDGGQVSHLATRLAGSSDLYAPGGRRPYASINFITSHDGFTLRDLVTYQHKHNEANGEANADGEPHNLSWNCGVEGPTADPAINALRARQVRNFLGTLLLSQGVPMIVAGDEMGRTQLGNNNAYCQDNEVSWINWDLTPDQCDLLAFTRQLVQIRDAHPVLRRRTFFQGRGIRGQDVTDILWFDTTGQEMTDATWNAPHVRALGVMLVGTAMTEVDERGNPVHDCTLLILLNVQDGDVPFTLPASADESSWEVVLDTSSGARPPAPQAAASVYQLGARSLAVLTRA